MCASGLSWVRRPRLYCSNVGLEDRPSFQRSHHQLYEVIDFSEELEPLNLVCDEGWIWPAAEVNKDIWLPTFTRAIPRKNAPISPAGLGNCNASAIERWKVLEGR